MKCTCQVRNALLNGVTTWCVKCNGGDIQFSAWELDRKLVKDRKEFLWTNIVNNITKGEPERAKDACQELIKYSDLNKVSPTKKSMCCNSGYYYKTMAFRQSIHCTGCDKECNLLNHTSNG